MEEQEAAPMTEEQAWNHLNTLIDLAAARPARARFTAVGEAAVAWAAIRTGSPRDVTSHSASETPLYKESAQAMAETVVYQHTRADHFGRPHAPGCEEWITAPEPAPEDEE